ncbi:MAG: hypothetical protein GQ574_12565 [Crocinitomix sp.]|nr:hypothetical protein [Crocinitomix sp.]
MNKLFITILLVIIALVSSCEMNEESKQDKIEVSDLLGGWRVVEKGWCLTDGFKSSRHSINSGEGWNQYYFTEDSLYQMEYPIDLFRGQEYSLKGNLIIGSIEYENGYVHNNYYRVRFDNDTLLLLQFYEGESHSCHDSHLVRADLKEDSVKFLAYNKVDWNIFKEKWRLSGGVSLARPDSFSCGFIEPEYLNLYKNDSTIFFKRDTLIYIEDCDTIGFKFGGYHGNHLNDKWTIHSFYLDHFCQLDTNCNGHGVPIHYDSGYE